METRIPTILSLILGVVLLGPTCFNQRFKEVASHQVEIRKVVSFEPPSQHNGRVVGPGDFVLESSTLRVVCGGMKRKGRERGAVLEAMLLNGPLNESIQLLTSRLQINGGYFPIIPYDMYVTWSGQQPVLRLLGSVALGSQRIHVIQEMTVGAEDPVLITHTQVTTLNHKPLREVSVGAQIDWGGAEPFVSGLGTLKDNHWYEGDFIGISSHSTSTLFAFQDSRIHTAAKLEWQGQALFLAHTDVISRSQRLKATGKITEKSFLVISERGLAQAVRRLGWSRGNPFQEVSFVLPYHPTGSEITILDSQNNPWVLARPGPDGLAVIPLPVPKGEILDQAYHAVASAYGHATSDPVIIPKTTKDFLIIDIPKGGRIRIRTIDTGTGHPVTARIRISGIHGTPSPNLGPKHEAEGAANIAITLEGEVTVPTEPGEYRVLVSHGPEWTLFDEIVEVTETFRPDVQAMLSHVVRTRNWIPCDFHVHAAPSYDSLVSLNDRVASLTAEGIRFAVPTDHNHVTDYSQVVDQIQLGDFSTITGVEITTWAPNFGHFNAFPYPLDPQLPQNGAPAYQDMTPAELFGLIRKRDPNIIIQVNHPRMEPSIGYFDLVGFDPKTGKSTGPYSNNYDLLEVWNGFDLTRPFNFEKVFREWMQILVRGQRVVATGNSDSHDIAYQLVGYPRTYVWTQDGDPKNETALVQSLKQGRAIVSSGPMLEATIDGLGPGETAVVTEGEVPIRIQVQAPPWMNVSMLEIFVNGEKVIIEDIPEPDTAESFAPVIRFNQTIDVPISEEGFIIVMVRGAKPMTEYFGRSGILPIAFTNPIWIKLETPVQESDAGLPNNQQLEQQ